MQPLLASHCKADIARLGGLKLTSFLATYSVKWNLRHKIGMAAVEEDTTEVKSRENEIAELKTTAFRRKYRLDNKEYQGNRTAH